MTWTDRSLFATSTRALELRLGRRLSARLQLGLAIYHVHGRRAGLCAVGAARDRDPAQGDAQVPAGPGRGRGASRVAAQHRIAVRPAVLPDGRAARGVRPGPVGRRRRRRLLSAPGPSPPPRPLRHPPARRVDLAHLAVLDAHRSGISALLRLPQVRLASLSFIFLLLASQTQY